jgi:hypothetical protein
MIAPGTCILNFVLKRWNFVLYMGPFKTILSFSELVWSGLQLCQRNGHRYHECCGDVQRKVDGDMMPKTVKVKRMMRVLIVWILLF